MDSKRYLQESARTASSKFHEEIIDAAILQEVLERAIRSGNLVDIVKKSLFYGRELDGQSELLKSKGGESDLDLQAIKKDIIHAALGIFTEATEMLEAILKGMKGKKLDEVNIFEELGDTEWYMAMMYRALNKTPYEAKTVNIDKLRKRYPNKFESSQAIDRDISEERKILENGHDSGDK